LLRGRNREKENHTAQSRLGSSRHDEPGGAGPMKDTDWIPNWGDPEEYPNPKDTSDYQWTWEFLRRNPIYQKICDEKWCKQMTKPPSEAMSMLKLNIDSSFPHYSQNDPTEQIVDDGQPGVLLVPLRLDKDVISILEPKDYEFQYRDGETKTKKLEGYYKVEGYTDNLDVVYPKIDLRLSLDQQFESLKPHLKIRQNKLGHKGHKIHTSKFPKYLRILDADNDDADKLDVIDVVLKLVLDDPKYNAESRFAESLESAKRFRDSDYQYISKYAYPHRPKNQKIS
jgi:hypothetical protein